MQTDRATAKGLPRDQHHRMLNAQAFEEHLQYLRAIGRSEETINSARELLYRIDRDLPHGLCAAVPDEIIAWLARPGWSAATRATYRSHVVRFGRWAVHGPNPCLDIDPSAGIARATVRRRLPRPAADDHVVAGCTEARPPWRLHCIIAAYGGLRCREIALLDREHITELEMVVHGKGDKIRFVPTDPYIWAAVKDLPAGPVTRQVRGGAATAHWVSSGTQRYLRDDLKIRTSLHRFRAWFATKALDACGDLRVVQELLGHESVATTQLYTMVNPARRRAAVAGLPRLA